MTNGHEVVRLPRESEPVTAEPVTPPGRLHGLAIAGMAVSALIGIAAMLAFITINWPGDSNRYLVFAFVAAGLGFLTCASAAVLTAARDTYTKQRPTE
jgi:hypothetical protein